MDRERGQIRFQEIPHSKPIQRFVAKKLQTWMKRFLTREKIESYTVEFNRSDSKDLVGCHIEITANGQQWKSSHYGRGIHQAFSQCLKNIA